jgi:EpsD family peptidyl-prolyl cis-trans isomerase
MKKHLSRLRAVAIAASTISLVCLSACHGSDPKSGQTLVRVNGDEITVHQLNDELSHTPIADKSATAQDAQRKQLLDALVDRQLLVGAAVHEKLDRDPNVMQAIDRAKAQILAQAYLQSRVDGLDKPSKTDVEAYFRDHPEFFAQRKLYEVKQVIIDAKDVTPDLNTAIDNAKTMDDVIAWLDTHKIENTKSESIRPSADLPPQILSKMQGHTEPQFFVLNEGGKSLLVSTAYLKDNPVTLQMAEPEIMRFLVNKKSQEAGEAELKRLRTVAKLEYTNQADDKTKETADSGKPLTEVK